MHTQVRKDFFFLTFAKKGREQYRVERAHWSF